MDYLKSLVYRKDIRQKRLEVLVFIFFIGCVIGWVYEEIFYYITEQWIGNRGFLYGPYLPVYGVGAVLMALFLHQYRAKPLLVFVMGMLITGVLEYATGLAMWTIYHRMWWDYTGEFLNIGGFVCLRSVLSFAVGGLALIYVIEPMEERLVTRLSRKAAWICIIGLAIMLADFLVTICIRY